MKNISIWGENGKENNEKYKNIRRKWKGKIIKNIRIWGEKGKEI